MEHKEVTSKTNAWDEVEMVGGHDKFFLLWPFFFNQKTAIGTENPQRQQALLPNNKSIERNYSPLWSLWRSEKNSRTGATSQSLLWNLYRRDSTPETKKCSVLFGLFKYQSGAEGRRWRLLYAPMGGKKKPSEPPKP